jgi:hypothetical protein
MTACSSPILPCSDAEQDAGGLLDAFLDPNEEGYRFAAVDDAVVVGEGDVHHRPDLDLVADGDRAPGDLVHAEDAGLRRVEDRRRRQRAVDAAIDDREGAAGEILDLPFLCYDCADDRETAKRSCAETLPRHAG